MNFKYGTESVGIDFFYTDTTPFFNRGVEGLIEDIDMSIDNTKYSFAFESYINDINIFVGIEDSNGKDEPIYKKVWNAIISMFKAIGRWFSSAWQWIKKKFGFGGTNDVVKASEAETKVKVESASKVIEKIEEEKAVTPEKADEIVEQTVTEVVKENKNTVDLTPIIPQIVEEVKNEMIKLLKPINEAIGNTDKSIKDVKSTVNGLGNGLNNVKGSVKGIDDRLNNMSKKLDDISKLVSRDDLTKVANELKSEILKITTLQKETDLKPILEAVKKEVDRVISSRKDVNLRSIVPEIVEEVKKHIPKHETFNYKELASNLSKEVSDILSKIKTEIHKNQENQDTSTIEVAEIVSTTVAPVVSKTVVEEAKKVIEDKTVYRITDLSKLYARKSDYTQEQEDIMIEVAKEIVRNEVESKVEDIKKDVTPLVDALKGVIGTKLSDKKSVSSSISSSIHDKLRRKSGYKSSTIAKKVDTNKPLTVAKQVKIEFTTYLFSDRATDTYTKKFKLFSNVYQNIKGKINFNDVSGDKVEDIKNAVKIMACSILYMGGLSDVVFGGVNFNSDNLVKLLSSNDGDFFKEIGLGSTQLHKSLTELLNRKALINLTEVKFDVPYDRLKHYDKSTYQRLLGNESKRLALSVEISKSISKVTDMCLDDLSKLDKYISKLSPTATSTRVLVKRDEKDIRSQFSYLKTAMKSFKDIGTTLYRLLYNSNMIKIRKTLQTHERLT